MEVSTKTRARGCVAPGSLAGAGPGTDEWPLRKDEPYRRATPPGTRYRPAAGRYFFFTFATTPTFRSATSEIWYSTTAPSRMAVSFPVSL